MTLPGHFALAAWFRSAANSVLLTNGLLLMTSALGLVLTARYLGVQDRGMYLTWSSWSALIGTLSMLGTQAFIVVAAHQLDVAVSVRQLLPMLLLGLSVALISSLVVTSWQRVGPAVIVGSCLLSCSGPVVALNAAVQQANGHHGWRFNLSRCLAPTLGLGGVAITLCVFDPSVDSLFFVLGLSTFFGGILGVLLTREPQLMDPRLLNTIRQYSRRGGLLVVLGWLLLNADTVLVSLAGDSTDVGIYGVGVAVRSIVLAVGTAVGLKWFAVRDTGSLRRLLVSFSPATLAAAAAIVCSPTLIPLVLGVGFEPSVLPSQLLAIGGLLASADFLLGHMVLIRSGYRRPTQLRLGLFLLLAIGILAVGGSPDAAAAVFCGVMMLSVLGQAAMLTKTGERQVVPTRRATE